MLASPLCLSSCLIKHCNNCSLSGTVTEREVCSILQLEELKLSERSLRTRVKSLNNELAVLKHGLRTTPGTHSKTNKKRRSTSTERKTPRGSVERFQRRASRASIESVERRTMRTPSPSGGSRVPRFDPTAYVKSKKKKQRDADAKLG